MKEIQSLVPDKILFFAEKFSLVLIFVPFVSIILWLLLGNDYFFFFPIAMLTFFPIGLFTYLIQRIKNYRKHPNSSFSSFISGMGILSTAIGVFTCLASCVATIN